MKKCFTKIHVNLSILSMLLALILIPSVSEAQKAANMPNLASLDKKTKQQLTPVSEKALKEAQENLRFEQNAGQIHSSEVLYKTTDVQATYFFTKNEIRSVVVSAKDSLQTAYALQFVGANEGVDIKGFGRPRPTEGATNYITHEGSFGDIPRFNRLQYQELWHGVDAHFYESHEGKGTLEYDFIVQPNADPSVIRLKMDGATDLKINAKGELEFTTPFGTLQKGKPYTYQTVNGKKVEITSAYKLNDKGEITFQLGEYDHTLPLVIDPIALKWSTYLMAGTTNPYDIYVHPTTGRIYLVGFTQSAGFPNTLGRTYGGGDDVFVTCMEKDGTSLVWSTYIGGASIDRAYALSVDAAGDVYVGGITYSPDFPVNGTTAAFDATHNGSGDLFVLRLNSTGSTLKYSTFVGGADEDAGTFMRKLVVTNGKVYLGSYAGSTDFPTTVGAYQQSVPNSGAAVLFCLNTNVGGTAGLEFSTFFAGLSVGVFSLFSEIEEDKDGNLWLVGATVFDPSFPISANAVQKYADFNYTGSTFAAFVAKFSKSGQYLYSSYVNPLWSPDNSNSSWSANIVPSLDVDAQGNVYVATATAISSATDLTVKKAPNILAFNELSPLSSLSYGGNLYVGSVAKIPYNLSPQYDFVSVFPSNAIYFSDPEIAIDKKGNIHLLTSGGDANGNTPYHPLTAGAVKTTISGLYPSVYYVLPPSGSSVLYGTVLGSDNSFSFFGMFVNDKCEAYLNCSNSVGANVPITPSYRDFETNTKKTVYNSTNNTGFVLAVFHEPIPNNNTIPDFAVGNNTFCVGGLIYQNPNNGPIIGSTASYTSGDGSSPTHNLPNMNIGAHPTPASPALQYQWQKSTNGGSTWTNIPNGTYEVYKPEPESTSGTVKYRRVINGFCGDSLSVSNVATAIIAGNFNLQISVPSKPVYYCPTVAGTSLGVSVTGASGNISWQWYDGYSPLSGTGIISPSSGTGVAQGSFTANIGTSASASGFYRLVVTDAGGCKKEAFVSIAPKTASAGASPTIALCPGVAISAILGPSGVNPDFDYSWTGPSGFTSTNPNPVVTTAGTYTLKVKLKTDGSFCNPGTTVTVTASTPHNAALTSLTNKAFCQSDAPAAIGLSGTAPSGYVFQWVPGTNLDNQQAFNPIYDPGVVPGGPPVGTTNYTFTALRLSDGCIFERTNTVTNTALAFAFAGSNTFGDGCTSGKADGVGGVETTGLYFQWTAIGTDFAAGLAALKANPAFGNDVLGQQVGTNKFLNAKFPLCSVNGNVGYYIDYELKASYIPFSNNCFTLDTVRVFVPCCGTSPSCPTISSNLQGTTGACSGITSIMSIDQNQGATYTWTTYSVNGVIQAANTPPRGLFVNNNGVKGAALAATGPHPASVIVDFDDATWGWLGNNVVVYEITQTIDLGSSPQTCFSRQQVFSGLNGTPIIGVLDQALCSIASPGIRVGTTGQSAPYTLNGSDFTQAPNSAFVWTWTGGSITSGANTPFPTVNPTTNTNYYVTVRDAATGCVAKDTLVVKVKSVIANAGTDLTDICPGSLVQLGTTAESGHSYSWSPSAGLNFPIGTPNSTTAQPYLTVPNSPTPPATLTYTVVATDGETGCVATDNMTITTSTTAPPAISAASYDACPSAVLTIGPSGSLVGATYAWTLVSGGNISYLSSTSVRQPVVTLPANFTGPAIFRLTMTKGTCGSVFADYTINNNNPIISLGGSFTATCTSPYTQIGIAAVTGYTYSWTPYAGLYTDAALTTPYAGGSSSQVYVRPTASTTYTLTRINTASGCQQTATVVVNPPAGVAVNAGNDKFWCPSSAAVAIGSTGSGTLSWTAIGYTSSLSAAAPTTIASPMTSGTMLGYLSSTSGASVNFSQSTIVSGQYVYRITSTSGGCSISDDVIVKVGPTLPTGIAGLSQTVCLGESVQIGATTNPTTLNYYWTALNPITASNTISDPTAARPFVTPSVNTTYQIIYTDAATGCSADEQVTVVVNPLPTTTATATNPTCTFTTANNNGIITLSGFAAGETYQYSVGSVFTAGIASPTTATAIPVGGVITSTLPNPTSATQDYTIRVFTVNDCYIDRVVTLTRAECCPTITIPSADQTLCVGTAGADITVQTDQNTASSITFVRFSSQQTGTSMYLNGGTVLSTVTPTGSSSPYTATLTTAAASWSTVAAGTYYVYAILNPTPSSASCRPYQEIKVVVNPAPTPPTVVSPVMNPCPTTTVNLNNISAALTPSVSGGVFEWHVSNSSGSALVSNPTTVGAGTYYLFEKSPNSCYSTGTPLQVQIQNCCPSPLCIPVTIVRNH